MGQYPDHLMKSILTEMDEVERLQSLSNEELVTEYLRLTGDQETELHINAMMERLFPEWDQVEL